MAKKMFRQSGFDPEQSVPGTDVSVEVLVNGAAIEFFEWCRKGKWKPKHLDEDPFPMAYRIMYNNFIDLVRSAGHQRADLVVPTTDENGLSIIDDLPAFDQALNRLLTKPVIGLADVDAKILAETFYPYAEGRQELKDVIDAVIYCQCRKPSEIAEWLTSSSQKITSQEVTDRWEVLRYNYTRHR
ncbi:MAG: hypothetical protein WAQ99_06505 [Pyrinomonadaceae bacterium]